MKKITKKDIADLAQQILDNLLRTQNYDCCVYYNNNRAYIKYCDIDHPEMRIEPHIVTQEGISPFHYFEYANPSHILSMSFEGNFYSDINYGSSAPKWFLKLLNQYSLYYEQGDAWNLSLYPLYDDMEIESTNYMRGPKPVSLHMNVIASAPPKLQEIMHKWYELAKATGDKGCYVNEAGFTFTYQETLYHLYPCSPYQGNLSWEAHIPLIRSMLEEIGCTDICYDHGIMS